MCPKCKALFNEASCSWPHPTGRGRAPARCPVMLWGKRCDTELVIMTKVNGVYVCSAAMSQKFTHLGIVNQLRQALSRPEICAHLFDHLKVRSTQLSILFNSFSPHSIFCLAISLQWIRREGVVRDLFDCACWQRWKKTPLPDDPTNYWFSPGFHHVALKVMCDAFQVCCFVFITRYITKFSCVNAWCSCRNLSHCAPLALARSPRHTLRLALVPAIRKFKLFADGVHIWNRVAAGGGARSRGRTTSCGIGCWTT